MHGGIARASVEKVALDGRSGFELARATRPDVVICGVSR
jgi:hypothetical protein